MPQVAPPPAAGVAQVKPVPQVRVLTSPVPQQGSPIAPHAVHILGAPPPPAVHENPSRQTSAPPPPVVLGQQAWPEPPHAWHRFPEPPPAPPAPPPLMQAPPG